MQDHHNGKVASTRYFLPIEVIFSKKYPTIREARQVEYTIQETKRQKVCRKIYGHALVEQAGSPAG